MKYIETLLNGVKSYIDSAASNIEGVLKELAAAKLSPTVKTSAMTQAVGKDENGELWTAPSGDMNTETYDPDSAVAEAGGIAAYVEEHGGGGGSLPPVTGSGKALVSVNGEWKQQEGYAYDEGDLVTTLFEETFTDFVREPEEQQNNIYTNYDDENENNVTIDNVVYYFVDDEVHDYSEAGWVEIDNDDGYSDYPDSSEMIISGGVKTAAIPYAIYTDEVGEVSGTLYCVYAPTAGAQDADGNEFPAAGLYCTKDEYAYFYELDMYYLGISDYWTASISQESISWYEEELNGTVYVDDVFVGNYNGNYDSIYLIDEDHNDYVNLNNVYDEDGEIIGYEAKCYLDVEDYPEAPASLTVRVDNAIARVHTIDTKYIFGKNTKDGKSLVTADGKVTQQDGYAYKVPAIKTLFDDTFQDFEKIEGYNSKYIEILDARIDDPSSRYNVTIDGTTYYYSQCELEDYIYIDNCKIQDNEDDFYTWADDNIHFEISGDVKKINIPYIGPDDSESILYAIYVPVDNAEDEDGNVFQKAGMYSTIDGDISDYYIAIEYFYGHYGYVWKSLIPVGFALPTYRSGLTLHIEDEIVWKNHYVEDYYWFGNLIGKDDYYRNHLQNYYEYNEETEEDILYIQCYLSSRDYPEAPESLSARVEQDAYEYTPFEEGYMPYISDLKEVEEDGFYRLRGYKFGLDAYAYWVPDSGGSGGDGDMRQSDYDPGNDVLWAGGIKNYVEEHSGLPYPENNGCALISQWREGQGTIWEQQDGFPYKYYDSYTNLIDETITDIESIEVENAYTEDVFGGIDYDTYVNIGGVTYYRYNAVNNNSEQYINHIRLIDEQHYIYDDIYDEIIYYVDDGDIKKATIPYSINNREGVIQLITVPYDDIGTDDDGNYIKGGEYVTFDGYPDGEFITVYYYDYYDIIPYWKGVISNTGIATFNVGRYHVYVNDEEEPAEIEVHDDTNSIFTRYNYGHVDIENVDDVTYNLICMLPQEFYQDIHEIHLVIDYAASYIQKMDPKLLPDYLSANDPVMTGSISLGRTGGVGVSSFAAGIGVEASGYCSHAEGNATIASEFCSHAEGAQTTASGQDSHAEGHDTTASAFCSHVEGEATIASGSWSHAEGDRTTASGESSHAEGSQTVASENYSHAEGITTTASGLGSHAEGESTTASGTNSHAEGNNATASGNFSHAEGTSHATQNYAHSESISTASGYYSHSESSSTASGAFSHAEGASTVAAGNQAHAEGAGTQANAAVSHAEGNQTIADMSCQHVQGKFNIANSTNLIDIVGYGTSDSSRKNIEATTTSGDKMMKGDVYVGCNDDSTGGSKLQKESISDSSGYFSIDTVEGALAELGAAKLNPDSKTSIMTQAVGKDSDGKLWTASSGNMSTETYDPERAVAQAGGIPAYVEEQGKRLIVECKMVGQLDEHTWYMSASHWYGNIISAIEAGREVVVRFQDDNLDGRTVELKLDSYDGNSVIFGRVLPSYIGATAVMVEFLSDAGASVMLTYVYGE